jgi:acetylglutamate kinase
VKLVVKIGGAAVDDTLALQRLARAVSDLAQAGHHVLVVHGGGSALTATLRELGREVRFVDGLRVTDAPTRDAAVMVFAGLVNKTLVAALGAASVPALGMCGGDLGIMRATPKLAPAGLGFVGDVVEVNAAWIDRLWLLGTIPVLASIALGDDSQYYNVNADEVASACAAAVKADALVFLTDVPGVRGADGQVVRALHIADIPALIDRTVVSGGMVPKLNACARALGNGVARVHILPAAHADEMHGVTNGGIECGTEVVA